VAEEGARLYVAPARPAEEISPPDRPEPERPRRDPRPVSELRRKRGRRQAPIPVGSSLRRYRILAVGIAASDVVSLLVAMQLWTVGISGVSAVSDYRFLIGALTPLVWIAVFQGFRLYVHHQLSPTEEFRRVIGASTLGMALVVLASFWARASLSRGWVALTWISVIVFELATRWAWRQFIRWLKLHRRLSFRTLIVGDGGEAAKLAHQLATPGLGFTPIGFVATQLPAPSPDGLPVLGTIDRLPRLIREHGADCVFVASASLGIERMRGIARIGRREGVEVRAAAHMLPEVLSTRLTVHPLGEVMSLCLSPVRLNIWQAMLKRSFDLAASAIGLLLTLPLTLLIAAAVKLDSPGPVLFRQERVGRMGNRFTILKFRTMIVGADGLRDELMARNEADGPMFKLRQDPRVTRVGRILRSFSLDELPQLWNVFRGDMSLVGPRPPLPAEVAAYDEWHYDRLEVAPGITGLWQVSGRSELSFEDYVRRDIFYIENWSLSIDVYILLKTIPAVLRRKGAW